MSDIPPWSVDSTIHVNRVHVIESLPPGEQSWYYRTGAHLFEELQDACARTPVEPHLHVVGTRDELCRLLLRLVSEAHSGHFPLLHFEMHGIERAPGRSATSVGLVLASGERMTWRDLAPYFVAINEATHLNLIVFMAACYGLDVATIIQPLERAPFRILIGPMRAIEVPEIDKATRAFYQTLFRENAGDAAVAAMNAAIDAARGHFLPLTAEWMFLQILLGYYNEMTTELQIAARAERQIVELILGGMPPAVATAKREEMRAFLRDREALFDRTYRTFFFVDRHPEIAARFRMTYESCFREASESVVQSVDG